MSCSNCNFQLNKQCKYCPECGTKNTVTYKVESLDDILNTSIPMTDLIYDGSQLEKTTTLTIKDLITKEFTHHNILSYIQKFGNETHFLINTAGTGCGSSSFWNKNTYDCNYFTMDNFVKNYNKKYLSTDSLKNRLGMLVPILKLCNIKHTYTKSSWNANTYLLEKIENILIALIENRIISPKCGSNFIGKLDNTLKELSQIFNDANLFEKNKDKTVLISFEEDSIKRYTNEYKSSFCKQIYGDISDSYMQNINSQVDERIANLKKFEEVQKQLDEQLSKITCDLYYSSKDKKIYSEKEITQTFNMFSDIYNLTLKDHCELFKIKHINVFILNEELDRLILYTQYYNDMNFINSKLTLAEGITQQDAINRMLGLTTKPEQPVTQTEPETTHLSKLQCTNACCMTVSHKVDKMSFQFNNVEHYNPRGHLQSCHTSATNPNRITLGKPLSNHLTVTCFSEFPQIIVIFDRIDSTISLRIYDKDKKSVINEFISYYDSELFIMNKELMLIKKDQSQNSTTTAYNITVMTIYPSIKEHMLKKNCQYYSFFKIDDCIIANFSNSSSHKMMETYDLNWRLLETLADYNMYCSCHKNLLVLSGGPKPQSSYYNLNKRVIVDTGNFVHWLDDDTVIERDRETKQIILKKMLIK